MFERSSHIAQLQSMLSACLEGEGQTLFLLGPAACGRTALLRRGVSEARQAGMRVMQAACSPWEGDLPGSVVSQLLASVGVFLELTESEVPSYRGFCREILGLASDIPLVIAIDDVHHADDESMRCLVYAARRLAAARVVLLLTCRCDDERSLSPYTRELLRQPGARRLAVAPLSETGVAGLLSERLGTRAAEPGLAAEMHRVSGGNLGLLEALISDCRGSGPGAGEFVTEQGYGAALTELLTGSGGPALPIARALAALGELGSAERVAQLAFPDQEVSAESVARTIATWTEAGLLRAGRFPHPAGRAAVLGTMPKGERSRLHLRAARLLHGQGEWASTVARHLVAAERRAEPWALQILTEAAEHELLAGRNRQAAAYLALAHESSRDEAERAALLQRLADVEWQRDPLRASRHLTSLVAAAKAGTCRPGTLPGLVWELLWFGRAEEAAAVLGALRSAEAAEPPLSAETRNLHAWLTATHPQLTHPWRQSSPPPPRAGGAAPEPRVTGLPESDLWLALTASLCEIYVSGRVTEHAEWLKQALSGLRPGENSVWACEAAMIAMLGLLDIGLPDTVLARCSELSEAGSREEERAWQAQLRALRAEALLRKGDLEEALKAGREALTLLPPQAWGAMAGLPLGTVITAATMSGQLDEAARYLAVSPSKGMLKSRYGLYYLHARGHHHVAAERTYAGLGDFLACGELAQGLGLDTASPVLWRASAAEAWLRVGNHDRARRLVREQLALPGGASDRSRGQALRVLAALSSPQRQPSLLLEAVELLEKAGDQYEQARALADLSHAYSRLGDSRRARTILRRARHLAQACQAVLLCEGLLAVEEPEQEGVPDDDKADQLTETERRVAHLAVLGYTNRDIAAKLYVTSSTVEQHLTRVYRKLSIRSRKDLPADLDTMPLRQPRRARQVRRPVQLSATTR